MLPPRAFTQVLALAFLAPFVALAAEEGCTRVDGKACARACGDGDAIACWLLGTMHRDGTGVRRDARRAVALYEQACAAGAEVACLYAAAAYASGSSSDDDKPPRPVKIVKPSYPQYAFDKKIEGTVEVQISIGASGKVTDACIAQSVPYLDHAALEAVYQWRFSPAIKNGSPVAAIARAPVMFRIY